MALAEEVPLPNVSSCSKVARCGKEYRAPKAAHGGMFCANSHAWWTLF